MFVTVASDVIATLIAEAARAAPAECCGVLLGHGKVIERALPAPNVAEEPERRFEIDPASLLQAHRSARQGGPQVLGYYHSHPEGHPVPSATDCEHASGDLRIWAIVAGREVRFWRDAADGFQPLSSQVIDG